MLIKIFCQDKSKLRFYTFVRFQIFSLSLAIFFRLEHNLIIPINEKYALRESIY